jgi:hypothetical protein
MQFEPIEVKTPKTGSTVVIRAFASARLQQALRNLFLKKGKLDVDTMQKQAGQGKEVKPSEIAEFELTADIITESQNVTVEHMVISVNGKTENVLEAILDMPQEDYDFILAEVEKVTKDSTLDDPKKKELPKPTQG